MVNVWVKLWRWVLIVIFLFAILIISMKGMTPKQNEQDLYRIKALSENNQHKKIILLVVDSIMSKNIDIGIKKKELPTIQFLIENGQYYKNLITTFPTMSVTIDSTLLTGTSPGLHHVPGLVWYLQEENRIINYGSGMMETVKNGINQALKDSVINLNQKHLNPNIPTLFDELEKLNVTSGSINGLIYRGKTPHILTIPAWISGPSSLPNQIEVLGPSFFSYGALSNPLEKKQNFTDDITKKYGFNNDFAIQTAMYLIRKQQLPDFLYIYLPDMDQIVHKKGPVINLKQLDKQLKKILDSNGTWEKALEKNIFIIIGDSGQTKVEPFRKKPIIALQELLKEYNISSTNKITKNADIVIAVNERMAYIYSLSNNVPLQDIANKLINNKKIDIIAWQNRDWINVLKGDGNEEFQYKFGEDYTDIYDNHWQLKGDINVLDIQINDKIKKTITYGTYPNALDRIAAALHSHKGTFLIVTAKKGYEFSAGNSPIHYNGSAHGSLDDSDSLVPLIITGTEETPKHLRMEDIKLFILHLLKNETKKE